MQRRFASTAASAAKRIAHNSSKPAISTAHLAAFPPAEAREPFFDAESWAQVQPAPSSALSAFAHRVGLGKALGDAPDKVLSACTHPSFVPLWQKHHPKETNAPETNANLASLGNSLLGMFASEYLHAKYPHLPTRVLKAAVSAYVGPTTCASIAKEMGAAALLRWNRSSATPTRPAVLHSEALSSIPRALTALVYTHHSLPVARKFVHSFFLSRQVDLRPMLKFSDPKKALQDTVRKYGRPRPVSRLLKETGRYSNSPMFVVGIYSGADKLGEGFGSSLKMAEYRAAEDSLLRLYLTQTPSDQLSLPTSTLSPNDLHKKPVSNTPYTAPLLGEQEVLYASAGRSSIVLGEGKDADAIA